MTDKSVNYFALDESENALDYLRRADQFISEAQKDAVAWKWVMIALHGALYGFAIAACPEAMTWKAPDDKGLRSIENFIQKKLKQRPLYRSDGAELISIDWAIKICLKQPGGVTPGGRPHTLTSLQSTSCKQLIKVYRNGFVHFHVQRSVVPGNELPLIAREVLDVINLCVSISYIDHDMQDEVKRIIDHAKATLVTNMKRDEQVNLPA